MPRAWENESIDMTDMQRLLAMKQYKAGLLKEARGILAGAQLEKRDLTTAEEKQYNLLNHEIDELGLLIETNEARIMEERRKGENDVYDIGGGSGGGQRQAIRMALDDRGREIPLLTHEQRMAEFAKEPLPEGIRADETLTGRIVRGIVTGWDGLDNERRALVGAEDPQGGFLLPAPLSARFIDLARARMVLSQAGAVTVPVESDSLRIVKLLADPVPYWRGELEPITESQPTFGSVTLRPKTVAILTLVSHEVWEDAAGLGRAVEDAMSAALALEFDRVGLMGGGEGNEHEPTGVYYTDGINTVAMDTNGAAPTDYGKFLDAIQDIEDANGSPAVVIYNPRTKRTLAGLTTGISGDKTPLKAPADFERLRQIVTTSIPNNLEWGNGEECSAAFVGGFPNVFMGLRDRIRIDVSGQAGDAFSKLGLWVRAFARVDFAVVRPQHLTRIVGIKKGDN